MRRRREEKKAERCPHFFYYIAFCHKNKALAWKRIHNLNHYGPNDKMNVDEGKSDRDRANQQTKIEK